jgi:aminoglycoside phosphotransferase (APT) family kinase protein
VTLGTLLSDPARGRLTEFLRRQYPELERLEILELTELVESWETDLFRLQLTATQNGAPEIVELVLRLYKGNDPLEQAQKEFSLMKDVKRFGVATPRVDALVTDRSILQHPFIVMEYISGGTLETRIGSDGVSQWLDPMLEVLVRIHDVPWVELLPEPKRPLPRLDEPLVYVGGLLDEMDLVIERHGLDGFEPTMGWLREREALGSSTQPVLIHNDYHPQNILLREDLLVVIDWSFAEIGDFRMDLAWSTLLLDVMVGGDYRAAMLEAYEQAAGTHIENFEFFEALKFTMRMVTIGMWLDEAVVIPVAGITKHAIRTDYKVHVMNPYHRLKEITGLEIPTIEEL